VYGCKLKINVNHKKIKKGYGGNDVVIKDKSILTTTALSKVIA
jgi:hypothetical protein